MRFSILRATLFLATAVVADVKFTTPSPGTTLPSNAQISVSWTDGGGQYPLSALAAYTLTLWVGGSTETTATPLFSINGDHATDASKTKIMPISSPALGPAGVNAYFLKMQSTGPSGALIINYSERFSIPAMTGSWASAAIQAAYNSVKGDVNAVPAAQVQGAPAAAAPSQGPAEGPAFEVPYDQQTTSTIMFAPMINYPGSSITATNTAKLYPTSHWSLATTFLPEASQVQTVTAARTKSATTRENTEAPASVATAQNDMEKFLNRWKD